VPVLKLPSSSNNRCIAGLYPGTNSSELKDLRDESGKLREAVIAPREDDLAAARVVPYRLPVIENFVAGFDQ
jgi:hypothetical protein